jgi:hypothetical protein
LTIAITKLPKKMLNISGEALEKCSTYYYAKRTIHREVSEHPAKHPVLIIVGVPCKIWNRDDKVLHECNRKCVGIHEHDCGHDKAAKMRVKTGNTNVEKKDTFLTSFQTEYPSQECSNSLRKTCNACKENGDNP